ncbi:sulfite exporter TauE/SafE family protein [Candidatus Gottesmanbacteria bacterium]|nr:sulfite exporter TauE/SafE family protein [Candidatus Gottesmanbacteria bacterium]
MGDQHLKKVKLNIKGMHCASCEVLIERKFKKVAGVEKVNVSHVDGVATLYCSFDPNLTALQNTIAENGYSIASSTDQGIVNDNGDHVNTQKDYFQIGAIFLIVVAVYLIGKQFNLVPHIGITDNMSYGFIFLIGLVAAMSTCIAVTGGLLLAVAAKYNEQNPYQSGWQKFKPNIYFNIGRVVSYTLLGGVIGALGSVLTLSPRINGFVSIGASLVMIVLGFQLLKLFPWMRRFQPKMPKFIAHKVHQMSEGESKAGPFILGASTFFLPCGFTQALQLYVLSKGDPVTGALTMLAFSLGTLPALLSLSAISSFIKGTIQNYFLKFAGVVVIMLGFFNVSNGLNLAGVNIAIPSLQNNSGAVLAATDTNVQVIGGKQIINMKVTGLNYFPYQFKVLKDVPVEWHIDGSKAEGCAQVVTVPTLGITQYLSRQGETVINFTPQSTGMIPFSCTMGMTTRGSTFTVVENTLGIVPATLNNSSGDSIAQRVCDPNISDCIKAQQVTLEISRERGIYPRSLTVKKGTPVELSIDDQVQLGGCMSVWAIPKYNVTIPMKVGTVKANFTPTETGTLVMTCSMGGQMAQFNVID